MPSRRVWSAGPPPSQPGEPPSLPWPLVASWSSQVAPNAWRSVSRAPWLLAWWRPLPPAWPEPSQPAWRVPSRPAWPAPSPSMSVCQASSRPACLVPSSPVWPQPWLPSSARTPLWRFQGRSVAHRRPAWRRHSRSASRRQLPPRDVRRARGGRARGWQFARCGRARDTAEDGNGVRRDCCGRPAHGRWRRGHRRSVAAPHDPLGGLQAGPGHHFLCVGNAVEPYDRGLAEHRFHGADRADRIVANGRPGARPDVRGQTHPLPDREGRRFLLLGARRPPWLRPGRRPDRGDDDRLDLIVVIVIVVIIICVDDHHLDVVHRVDLDDVIDDDLGFGGVVDLFLRSLVGTGDGVVGIWSASRHI